ncbi:MAG: J domain-containing protein [Haloferacaceae archaeon]
MAPVHRETIVVGLAAVMAGMTAFMLVVGATFSPFFFFLALPFAGATYVMWRHATGRLDFERVRAAAGAGVRAGPGDGPAFDRERRAKRNRRRARRGTASDGAGAGSGRPAGTAADRLSRREASRTLGVDVDAPPAAVKRAYRERVKETHPDTDGGSPEEFKRVNRAYERLRSE